jgi:hypothetical protein
MAQLRKSHGIRGNRAELLGVVTAPDEKSAIKESDQRQTAAAAWT